MCRQKNKTFRLSIQAKEKILTLLVASTQEKKGFTQEAE